MKDTNQKLKRQNIFGFSGAYLKSNISSRKLQSALIQNQYWKIFLFYNSADTNHHLPQDSLGVNFSNNEISFAIADGVSIVNGTRNNSSANVSLDLIKTYLQNNIDEKDLDKIKKEYRNKGLEGASTLQFGKINTSQFETHFFGPLKDLGLSYYLDSSDKLVNFAIDGINFFPQVPFRKRFLKENIKIQGIFSSSDGVKLTENNIQSLFLLMREVTTKEKINEKLLSLLPYSFDDQSIIIITKRC